MARTCILCGHEISSGIVCEKCDKPRKPKAQQSVAPATEAAHALDPFPKAQVVPFPVEAASPAITSVVDLLVASGVPAILLGPDKSVKFVSDQAKALFDASATDLASVRLVEEKTGLRIGDLSAPASMAMRIHDRNMMYSLVPMAGGAGGAVLVFRPADVEIEHRKPTAQPILSVTEVVRRVADRFIPYADIKGIHLQVDAPELFESFADHEHLGEALAILLDNSLHYVPSGGSVVLGVRSMEHKEKPLLLFFVMDNGPLVPENLRQVIFEPSFVWNPSAPERTGRGLFKCREFAVSHAGSVWVDSKTGKACTFYLRVRPDGVQ
jgi:hypothetical protein